MHFSPGEGGSPENEEVAGLEGELTRFQNSTVGFALLPSAQCLVASAFSLTHTWWGQERVAGMD